MKVTPDEKLTHFIFSRKHFAPRNGIVKFGAFMPPPDSEELSVFRISSLSDSEVWEIGSEYVETKKED